MPGRTEGTRGLRGRRRSGFGRVEKRPESDARGEKLHGVNVGAEKHYEGELVVSREARAVRMSTVIDRGSVLMIGVVVPGILMAVLPLSGLVVRHRLNGRLVMDRAIAQLTQHRFRGSSSVSQEKNECNERTPTHQGNRSGGLSPLSESRTVGRGRQGQVLAPWSFIEKSLFAIDEASTRDNGTGHRDAFFRGMPPCADGPREHPSCGRTGLWRTEGLGGMGSG